MAPEIETDRYPASDAELIAKAQRALNAKAFTRTRAQDVSLAIFAEPLRHWLLADRWRRYTPFEVILLRQSC